MASSTDPATWVHESSIIKEDELREVAELLGRGFRVHNLDAVGGISLSHNPNPQKYMVMHYHSMENGFRLPLRGLVRDICRHFGFAPGQLTANAHKYVASYILRYCALNRTPTLDEFLILFSIGGPFPYYSLFPHPQAPIFERVELKINKWARRYFVIEFPVHSPIDLPAESSSGNQAQGNSTALAICKPAAALEAVPISAIPGLRKPTPSQKRPREGVTDDDFLPKKNKGEGTPASPSPLAASSGTTQNTTPVPASGGLELPNPDSLDREADELPNQAPLKRPAVQPQPVVNNTSQPTAATSQGVDEGTERPPTGAGTLLEQVLFSLNALHSMEQAQQSLLTLTEEYLGGAWGNYRAMVVLKEKEMAARALQLKVDSLEQQVQVLQEENVRIKAQR
ncbi:unnamed protein product [Cuscuta campestris]|uniref:Uncharacterized protein n=1 Tax=Cuscuta campestris TaxID=132261 RepID=A0A484N0W3_9ASTE|nr:unnamed protein product [Cuscuta campestris]